MAYRKVYTRFWLDEKVQGLCLEDKAVALYCLTGPQTNRIGLYCLSLGAAAEHCETLPQTFAERFENVCETLNWHFDERLKVLYTPTWWKWNPPENPNVLVGCLKDLEDVPETPLLQEFGANTGNLPGTLPQTFRKRFPPETETETRTERRMRVV